MIVKDETYLRRKCGPVKTRLEGGRVARTLTDYLLSHNKREKAKLSPRPAVGLAAPQLGIYKQVAVVLHRGAPIALLNPAIVEHSHVKVSFTEGCLSFPGKKFDTFRWPWVVVQSTQKIEGGHRKAELWHDQEEMLFSVALQHEIAHLHGLLAWDFSSEDYPDFPEWNTWQGQPTSTSSVGVKLKT